MRMSHIGTVSILLFTILVSYQNCSQKMAFESPVPQPQLKNAAALNSLIAEVSARDLSCAQDSDCVALAKGSKACGGPTSYVVASNKSADFASLEALIAEFTRQEHQDNIDGNAMSTCSYEVAPAVACANHACAATGNPSF